MEKTMNFFRTLAINMGRLLAETDQLKAIGEEVNTILNIWVGPIFIALGGVGFIYIIVLAVQYAKSENDSKRAEAKTRIVNCVIGVIALLVIAFVSLTIDWASVVQIFGYTSSAQ